MSNGAVLEKIGKIERDLQKLKVGLLLRIPRQKKGGIYSDKAIVNEISKVRKQIWNEKNSRRI